ncbi:MAG: cytochrome c oxidase subunit I [Roseiflexaceae bacterium]|nr:MAG: cytochrome c oxidase subunit I [Chloroflexota bacterium]
MAIAEQHVASAHTNSPDYEGFSWRSWLATVDHKKIGIIYIVVAFAFFVLGGIEAVLMRVQLGAANNTFLTADTYNQLFTMHATTMIFLVIMPMNVGIGNYIVPLMVGARDMAFPRLNALSIWLFIGGGLLLYLSFLTGGAPNAGWFAYAPLTQNQYSPGAAMDYWVLGLGLTGIASIAGGLNFIVTVLNMRAPGMTLNRLPLFVWMNLVVSFIIIFAFPTFTVASIQLLFDRQFGGAVFNPAQGGDALLWQHLFWFFGHPEVYILILPVMGMVSEILPTFSRKPIFGYSFVAYSGVAIGFLGFIVWAHHMFGTGMGPMANAFFSGASMVIAIPTGVKIFNWIATMWSGDLRLTTAMLYAIGFISMFIIGGISGITLASSPIDLQQTDSYYVVAHLHYVLFGGSILGLFAGGFYWFPKITGRMLDDKLGKIQFWLMMVSFNLTFFPMHIAGTEGMPRRIYTYEAGMGWEIWNQIETVGTFLLALSVLMFLYNAIKSIRSGERASNDPWDASTLEWMIPSPPPSYNFLHVPTVTSRRPLWDAKYPHAVGDEHGGHSKPSNVRYEYTDENTPGAKDIHMPTLTFSPMWLSGGLTIAALGFIYINKEILGLPEGIAALGFIAIGIVMVFVGIRAWVVDSRRDSPYMSSHH